MTHDTAPTAERPVHEGRNVKRIREILGIKQDDLATRLGLTQQAVSQLEAKEALDRELVDKVAMALSVNPEAIRNFSEENAYHFFNTFQDHSVGAFNNYNCTFNALDELMKAMEENKRLYERLLESEREKVRLLETMLKK